MIREYLSEVAEGIYEDISLMSQYFSGESNFGYNFRVSDINGNVYSVDVLDECLNPLDRLAVLMGVRWPCWN